MSHVDTGAGLRPPTVRLSQTPNEKGDRLVDIPRAVATLRLSRIQLNLPQAARRALRSRNEEGTALVEFAFVAPILVAVLTGVMSFSMALYTVHKLSSATSVAVSLVAAKNGLATDPCATAATSVTGSLPSWTAGNFTYTMWITDASWTSHQFGPTAGSGFTCASGVGAEYQGYPIVLQVQYQYSWFPILNFSPSSQLTSTHGATAD